VKIKLSGYLLLISFTAFALMPVPARAAVGIGDAALTVAISTVSGAVLGASTLPFYEDSGKHTKNIFYGAALGAVVGVLYAAYAGVSEGPLEEEEEARLMDRRSRFLEPRPSLVSAEITTKRFAPSMIPDGDLAIWAPLTQIRF
jgi:hypothetical protein